MSSREEGPAPHSHARHNHGVSTDADVRYLSAALGLLLVFLVAELVVALVSGSLALLSDAGHMLSDVGALAVAVWAVRLAARPAAGAWTFGWKRAEILAAAINGLTLLVLGVVLGIEAVRRLVHPAPVAGGPVLLVAAAGCVVNVAVAWLVARADRSSLNVEGAYRHIVTDLFGFLGTVVAALVILATGWSRADAVASLVVVGLMLHAAYGLLTQAGRILLEAAPAGTDLGLVRHHMLDVEHVVDVHDLHVWTVTSNLPTVSAHVVLDDECFTSGHAPRLLDELQACLGDHFDVTHSTFQLEPARHADHEAGHLHH